MIHEFIKEIKCPYCDHLHDECDYHIEEEVELQCESCGKNFHAQAHRSVEYSTVGDCKLNHELPHILVQQNDWTGRTIKEFQCSKCYMRLYDWQLANGRYPKLKEDEYTINEKDS